MTIQTLNPPFSIRSAVFAVIYAVVLLLLWQLFLQGDFKGSSSYSRVAKYFLDNGTFESGYRPPFYPLMIAGSMLLFKSYWAFATVCLQIVLAVFSLLMTLFIVRRITNSAVAQLACFILWVANVPLHLEFLSQRETSLNIFLVLLSTLVFLEYRGIIRVALLGVFLALVHMTRPEGIVPAVLFGAIFLGWNGKSLSLKVGNIMQSLAAFAIFIICISPWQIYLNKVTGKFNLGSSEILGVNLWKGNNPYLWDYYPRFEIDRTQDILRSELNVPGDVSVEQLELNPSILEIAKRFVIEDPLAFLVRTVIKAPIFFSPVPIPLSTATITKDQDGIGFSNIKNINPMLIVIYTGLSLIFFAGTVLCLRKWRELPDYLKIVSGLFIVSLLLNIVLRAVFFYEWRYRSPLEPFFIIFCSFVLARRFNKQTGQSDSGAGV